MFTIFTPLFTLGPASTTLYSAHTHCHGPISTILYNTLQQQHSTLTLYKTLYNTLTLHTGPGQRPDFSYAPPPPNFAKLMYKLVTGLARTGQLASRIW